MANTDNLKYICYDDNFNELLDFTEYVDSTTLSVNSDIENQDASFTIKVLKSESINHKVIFDNYRKIKIFNGNKVIFGGIIINKPYKAQMINNGTDVLITYEITLVQFTYILKLLMNDNYLGYSNPAEMLEPEFFGDNPNTNQDGWVDKIFQKLQTFGFTLGHIDEGEYIARSGLTELDIENISYYEIMEIICEKSISRNTTLKYGSYSFKIDNDGKFYFVRKNEYRENDWVNNVILEENLEEISVDENVDNYRNFQTVIGSNQDLIGDFNDTDLDDKGRLKYSHYNTTEINKVKRVLGGDGVIKNIVEEDSHISLNQVYYHGQNLMNEHGHSELFVNIKTSVYNKFQVGDYVYLYSPSYDIGTMVNPERFIVNGLSIEVRVVNYNNRIIHELVYHYELTKFAKNDSRLTIAKKIRSQSKELEDIKIWKKKMQNSQKTIEKDVENLKEEGGEGGGGGESEPVFYGGSGLIYHFDFVNINEDITYELEPTGDFDFTVERNGFQEQTYTVKSYNKVKNIYYKDELELKTLPVFGGQKKGGLMLLPGKGLYQPYFSEFRTNESNTRLTFNPDDVPDPLDGHLKDFGRNKKVEMISNQSLSIVKKGTEFESSDRKVKTIIIIGNFYDFNNEHSIYFEESYGSNYGGGVKQQNNRANYNIVAPYGVINCGKNYVYLNNTKTTLLVKDAPHDYFLTDNDFIANDYQPIASDMRFNITDFGLKHDKNKGPLSERDDMYNHSIIKNYKHKYFYGFSFNTDVGGFNNYNTTGTTMIVLRLNESVDIDYSLELGHWSTFRLTNSGNINTGNENSNNINGGILNSPGFLYELTGFDYILTDNEIYDIYQNLRDKYDFKGLDIT